MNVELSILAGNTAATAYSYANEWMAGIPDEALLSSVNIPATHDTGTAGVVDDLVPSVSITSCQNLYYDEQLNMGDPKVVFVDDENRIARVTNYEKHGKLIPAHRSELCLF